MNIGIIGLGSFGEQHVRAISAVDGLKLVAVSRRNKEALSEFCAKHDVQGYTNYKDLVSDERVDAVIISTPHNKHTEAVEAAAAKGLHILLEKPLAENAEGVKRIRKAVEKSQGKFMGSYSNHFTPAFKKAKEIVFSGEIGEPVSGSSAMHKYWMGKERREWHLYRKNGGGMWLTIGVHLVDRLTYLFQSEVESVSARLGTFFHDQDAHDSGTAYLRYKNGAAGFISCIGYKGGAPLEETFVVGTKASLKVGLLTGVSIGKDNSWEFIPGTGTDDLHLSALTNEWRTFKKFVETGEDQDVVGMEFASHIMDVVFAAERSSEENREVRV